jgi:sulfide:quinone oxidoreductase
MSDSQPFKVLIVGGGSAALEAAFSLQRLAGDMIDVTILAPEDDFTTHAMAVLVPFASGHVPKEPLIRMASDARAKLRRGRMAHVDTARHDVMTDDGEAIAYDALLIAVGAVKHVPYPHALTFGPPGSEERMHGLIQDLEAGYVRRVAFVVPSGASWPMPLYELALMTAERAYEVCEDCDLFLVTAEEAPMSLFGPAASRTLEARLAEAGIALRARAHAHVVRRGLVELHPGGERLTVDRIVTLPTLEGPAVAGLPQDAQGFLPVDPHGRVLGAVDVYAAGDATNFPIKQGGLACQEANAAAEAIAAQAGVAIESHPFAPMLRGVLLTERTATFMRRDASGATGDDSAVSAQPLWSPGTKITGRELGRRIGQLPLHAGARAPGRTSDGPSAHPRELRLARVDRHLAPLAGAEQAADDSDGGDDAQRAERERLEVPA